MKSNLDPTTKRCLISPNFCSYYGNKFSATYNQLKEIFGDAHSVDDDKSHYTWFLLNHKNEPCNISDFYPHGGAWRDADFSEIWHISAVTQLSADIFTEELKEALKTVKTF